MCSSKIHRKRGLEVPKVTHYFYFYLFSPKKTYGTMHRTEDIDINFAFFLHYAEQGQQSYSSASPNLAI